MVSKYAPKTGGWGIIIAVVFCNMLTLQTYALEESIQAGGSNAAAVHQLGETGEGVNIGLMLADNVRITHEAFKDSNGVSHAFNYDFSGDGILITSHDTALAGIISSRGGAARPYDIGVAPGADIHCARTSDDDAGVDWFWLRDALDELINTHNCRVIVTGYEFPTDILIPDGNSDFTILYDYYAYTYDVIFANPAGNQNTAVTVFGDAYNGVTTGGLRLSDPNDQYDYRRVGSNSGSGTTTDGRRKPEITAPTESQTVPYSLSDTAWITTGSSLGETSYSVPQAAGAAALLLGLADDTPGPNDNHSEVIKAVMVNSAMPNVNDKTDNPTYPADSNNTWQNQRGYGRLDVLRAYQTLNTIEVEPDVNITQDRGWAFGRLTQGQAHVYIISIEAPCRLIATLTWQRRVTWTDSPVWGVLEPDELNTHLADLDMIVYSPYEPNFIFEETVFNLNPSDNLEKCDLLVTQPGDYTIVIYNDSTNGETANYGLAFEQHPVITGDLPAVDYIVDYYDLQTLADEWLSSGTDIDWLLYVDGIIDFADLAKLAENWLQTDPMYYPAQ